MVETPELPLQAQKGLGIGDGGSYFLPIADNAGILEQGGHFGFIIGGNETGIEIIKGPSISLAFPEDGQPTQTRLCPIEDQIFQQHPVIVPGHTPFRVVITDHQRVRAGPGAADGPGLPGWGWLAGWGWLVSSQSPFLEAGPRLSTVPPAFQRRRRSSPGPLESPGYALPAGADAGPIPLEWRKT